MAITYKCFLLQPDSTTIYGVITENASTIGLQRMRLSSFGKLIPAHCPPIYEAKVFIKSAKFIPTKNEAEAIEHVETVDRIRQL